LMKLPSAPMSSTPATANKKPSADCMVSASVAEGRVFTNLSTIALTLEPAHAPLP
jgi:hypothetical protein